MKKNFPYSIEWTKDRYTIPETISVLVKEGGLSGCNNKESKGYKTLYQALRRGLEKKLITVKVLASKNFPEIQLLGR